jgi:hypothetical protein
MIDIDELGLLHEKATPEPWRYQERGKFIVRDDGFEKVLVAEMATNTYRDQGRYNQELITALRNAAPELIAMARRWQTMRRYLCIDDVGDDTAVYALCVHNERLEEDASRALCCSRPSEISVEDVVDAMEQKP